jgi:DNA polymerase I-like protein with 3'-5' exonuclease and polymerase domains
MAVVFDIEGDGLLDTVTKIYCLSYNQNGEHKTLTSYDDMRRFLSKGYTLVGHNIVRFDIPVLEKILGIKIKNKLVDTLALSWYLNTKRAVHNLDSFGEQYGIPKPKIDDWENLSLEEYIHRCEEDVKINTCLWKDLRKKLLAIYDTKEQANRLIQYLTFKLRCAAEAEQSEWKMDVSLVETCIDELLSQQAERVEKLVEAMPPRKIVVKKIRPSKPYKKDGTLSTHGAKWFELLRELQKPDDLHEVEYVGSKEEANPNSPDQVKDWLYSLGWEPRTFDYKRNKETMEERAIPQIRKDGELSPCVQELIEKHPEVEILEGLTVIQHRLGIFKGFLGSMKNGYLSANIHGFTNTLRFKHKKPLVNLPGVKKVWGDKIRGSLIADDGTVLCGTDMVSLEDTTKRHYMYPYDPEYVEEMSNKDFDPHLDLAKHAGAATTDEVKHYLDGNPDFKHIKQVRSKYKVANYACIYGVRKNKLSRETGLPPSEAQDLIDAYWKRNWSVIKVIEDQYVKRVNGEMWLLNPVSNLYYSLRFEKDIFSTLNQGTGVFCFDSWIKEKLKLRDQFSLSVRLIGQFHDETVDRVGIEDQETWADLGRQAIKKVNERLKLNIKLDIKTQFGTTYAEIH